MLPSAAVHDFDTLPPVAQQQVVDFISFIKVRYQDKTKKSFVDVLTTMPNVGQDTDFNRVQDELSHDVFT